MKTPTDAMLDQATWFEYERVPTPNTDVLAYATHHAVLTIAGHTLRCYQLNTGQRVIDADDIEAFFS